MKKRKNNRGSLLVESLVSLSIMSVLVVVMVPSLTQMFRAINEIKSEVEGWRYFQDSVQAFNKGDSVTNRTSDGNVMVWRQSVSSQMVTIESNDGIEVLSIEIYP